MSKRRASSDPDYVDPVEESFAAVSGGKKTKAQKQRQAGVISKPLNKKETQSFLDQNAKVIREQHANGLKPANIAAILSNKLHRPGAVTNRQISNWLYQKKKSAELKTFPVSASNNNLRADRSDQSTGWQDDLTRIAREDGLVNEEIDAEEAEESSSEEERLHYELASKLLRFFTHNDEDYFFLFVECGVKRVIHVKPVFDSRQLELSVSIPVPDDALFHFVGIKHATDVTIEPTEEVIYITPPRKLAAKSGVKFFYPSEKKPLFVAFKYEMEVPVDPEEAKVNVDLTDLFEK
jgi:hypothetical protein